MIAWDALKAASSLLVGTAWELLNSPKTGGTGVVINDGYTVSLGDVMQLELQDTHHATLVQDEAVELVLVSPTITELA